MHQTERIEPTASTPREPFRVAVVVGSASVIACVGLVGAFYFVLGCSENLHPGTDRERVCNNVDGLGEWLLLIIGPLLVLLVSQAVPWFRRHAWFVALVILGVTLLGWTYVLLILSGNIGATTIG